ncbi:MAG: SHOCT domain-containing protein [Candidatus Bathyarchaeota archaeon]|nr:SHOCT domain-containing protein [Candidatus Bathyarchaeota archaeon]
MMFGYWPFGGMMWIWILVFGALCYWGYGWFRPRGCRTYRVERTPLEIAQGRLARGEITSDEYEKIRKTLVER